MAFVADLPPPDEIIRALGGDGQIARRTGGNPPPPQERDQRAPLNEASQAHIPSAEPAPSLTSNLDEPAPPPPLEAYGDLIEGLGDEDDQLAAQPVAALRPLRGFEDVVELAGERRDARLRAHLEEYVSLVKFDGAAGSIDLFLLPGAPAEIANDLREKLNRWTERRWMVVLSKTPGEPTIGQQRRERDAAELASLKKHPGVAAVFDAFPDARVAEVRRSARPADDEAGTG
jgi:DNA polymerase-3 subunit gamma/tau